ncbi:hypothetical protein CJ030_MR1G007863 [Morella rubra]|uniref:Uncharacterized protein n=1 Tax=Morella rubra TaxID=262757 RepID=A0A6A1WX48_9ROSI|nr:hypothetical protein CJ030_MR1G007863 [Morella rubra]
MARQPTHYPINNRLGQSEGQLIKRRNHPRCSDILQLFGLDNRIGLRDLLPPLPFEVEGAPAPLRELVGPAKGHPALALEPRQPHAPPASQAPVWLSWRYGLRLRLNLVQLILRNNSSRKSFT